MYVMLRFSLGILGMHQTRTDNKLVFGSKGELLDYFAQDSVACNFSIDFVNRLMRDSENNGEAVTMLPIRSGYLMIIPISEINQIRDALLNLVDGQNVEDIIKSTGLSEERCIEIRSIALSCRKD
jgi:hypothetical protein